MDHYQGRNISNGLKVFVYFHFRKKMFSVRALEGEHKGKVVAHVSSDLLLKDCKFTVSQKGRERVITTGQKNVHAGIVGRIELSPLTFIPNNLVHYNPFFDSQFILTNSRQEVFNSEVVFLKDRKVYI